MPVVPIPEGPTVKAKPLDPNYTSSQVPENAFGEGTAYAGFRAAQSLSGLAGEIQRQQHEADTARVEADLATFDSERMSLLADAQETQGKNAIGIAPKTSLLLELKAQEYAGKLANNRQRDKFIPHAKRMLAETHAALLRHEGKETRQNNVNSSIAIVATSIDAASRQWTQPEIVQGSLKRTAEAVSSRAAIEGWSAEETANQQAIERSAVWSGILRAQDTQGAHAAFIATYQAIESQLTEKDRADFAKTYTETSDLATTYSTTDAIWKTSEHNLDKALALAADITDPKKRRDVEAKLKGNYDADQAGIRQAQEKDEDAGWSWYYDKGTPEGMPRELYGRLHADQPQVLKAMRDDMERKARERANGPQATDWGVYGNWLGLEESEKYRRGDPRKILMGHVTDAQMERALETWRDIRNQIAGVTRTGATAKPPGTPVERGTIDSMIRDAGPKTVLGGGSNEYDRRYGLFHDYVRDRVADVEDSNQRKASREEVQAEIDKALIRGSTAGGFWGFLIPDVRQYQTKQGEPFKPNPGQTVATPEPPRLPLAIPADELPALDEAIRLNNEVPDDEKRRKLYLYHHRLDDVKP